MDIGGSVMCVSFSHHISFVLLKCISHMTCTLLYLHMNSTGILKDNEAQKRFYDMDRMLQMQ